MIANKLTNVFFSQNGTLLFKLIRNISTNPNEVIFQNVKDKGVIILNRPDILNALNITMVKQIVRTLNEWESQKSLVIIKGAGDKAFCCGGDLKNIFETRENKNFTVEHWEANYKLVRSVKGYKIPYIAFIDGVAMGVGAGLCINGRYRIATERSVVAMPETRIGIFPDAGASHFLSKLDGYLGQYLALTGRALKGFDVFVTGLATHYCESEYLDELEAKLLNCSNVEDIETTLSVHANHDKKLSLEPIAGKINTCFSAGTVEEIISRLEEDGSQWANNTIEILLKNRPLSLKVALKELEFGRQLSFDECINLEITLLSKFTEEGILDFEGIRAILVDKDQNPKWNPQSLSEISEEYVSEFFQNRYNNN